MYLDVFRDWEESNLKKKTRKKGLEKAMGGRTVLYFCLLHTKVNERPGRFSPSENPCAVLTSSLFPFKMT